MALGKKDIVFVGSHGCSKRSGDKHLFEKGLKEMIKRIDPAVICIYGTVSSNVSQLIESNKIKLIVFESEFSLTHEER